MASSALSVVHFATRNGCVACKTAIESVPRMSSHPDLVTCGRCKGTGAYASEVRRLERRRKKAVQLAR